MLELVVRYELGCGETERGLASGTGGIRFFSLRLKKDMLKEEQVGVREYVRVGVSRRSEQGCEQVAQATIWLCCRSL